MDPQNNQRQKRDLGRHSKLAVRSIAEKSESSDGGNYATYISQSPVLQKQAALFDAVNNANREPNLTGLPDQIKTDFEAHSGYDLSDVRVMYNSDQPAQLMAHAFAYGNEIHIAPGQEEHLGHELWHVVQQKQGRVKGTAHLDGFSVNEDQALEKEADEKGIAIANKKIAFSRQLKTASGQIGVVQRKIIARVRTVPQGRDLPRIVSEVRLEGRAPTDAKGRGQGDHTVAETLINESVIQEIVNQPRQIALNNLMVLADITLDSDASNELRGRFDELWPRWNGLEGEDQNTYLEEFIQRYIELANKRPGTAFARNLEVTRGGGGERQAIGFVRTIAKKNSEGEEILDSDLYELASNLIYLIDFKYKPEMEDRYLSVIVRALQHAVLSVVVLTRVDVRRLIETLITGLGQRDGFPVEKSQQFFDFVVKNLGV